MARRRLCLTCRWRWRLSKPLSLKPSGKTIADVIRDQSANADIVFLGLRDPEPGTEKEYARRMKELAEGLNTTVFVKSAGEFAGKLI